MIYILPTDKQSLLCFRNYFFINKDNITKYSNVKFYNIYITNDEEIKEGNWFLPQGHINPHKLKGYNKINGDLESYNGLCYDISKCKKIILTTDQELIKDGIQEIDDKFLEWFINNQSCEFVDVYEVNNKLFAEPFILSNKTHYLDELPNIDKNIVKKMFNAVETKLEFKQLEYTNILYGSKGEVELENEKIYDYIFDWLVSKNYLLVDKDIAKNEFKEFKKINE